MQYDTINDLIRSLNLDMTHWINKESIRFIRHKAMEKMQVKLEHIPKELENIYLTCPQKHVFKPNWLEKRHPVSTFYSKEKGLLRQESCQVKCPKCEEYFFYSINQAKYRGELNIFGDEAFRKIDGKTVFVYSFVSFSGSKSSQEKFEESFLKLKESLAPSINPNSWELHMKEIMSTDKRNKKKHLKHLSSSIVKEQIDNVLQIIDSSVLKGDLNVYSAIGIAASDTLKNEEEIKYKEHIYNSALLQIVSESTSHGLAPKFYFERTRSDGWAKNLFDGGRLTLLWAYITNGLPVMTPQFVSPSHSLYLEMADLVSYIIARYLFLLGQKVEGKSVRIDFNPSQIGNVRYILTDAQGDWYSETSKGFPVKKMFKNTSWEKYT